ncbi:MAG: helix-turn-helix domain-containing protein [Deltaproteobacteria bacterium]|nr:helix-turn-helix domain-containing protein [Deltaproteobacteria bacterium]
MEQQVYVSVRQAAAAFGVCEHTIRRWIVAGHLDAVRLGRTIKVRAASIYRRPVAAEDEANGGDREQS